MRIAISAILLAAATIGAAWAQQGYPNRPIRLLVGFAPGGAADLSARLVSRKMGTLLGTTIVVENRGGAGGVPASNIVASAEPDGYTLLWGSVGALAVSPALGVKLPYDPLRDFAPIAQTITLCNVLVIAPSFRAKTVKEIIALARAQPGKITYGTPGIGSAGYVSAELFKHLAGIDMVHVPYKGGSEIINSMVADKLDMAVTTISTAKDMGAGRVKPIAVTSSKRDPALPDVPTFAEAGVPGYEANVWMGLLGPKGTPPAIVKKLSGVAHTAVTDPEVRKSHEVMAVVSSPTSPEEFRRIIEIDYRKWAKVLGPR